MAILGVVCQECRGPCGDPSCRCPDALALALECAATALAIAEMATRCYEMRHPSNHRWGGNTVTDGSGETPTAYIKSTVVYDIDDVAFGRRIIQSRDRQ